MSTAQILLWPVWLLGLGLVFSLLWMLYNIFLHPLRSYPGPLLWAATPIPYTLSFISGASNARAVALHKKYGPVVRVGPSRLSFTTPDAWRDIRGHRKNGEDENTKEEAFYSMSRQNIVGASRDDHARFRRVLAHGFSAKVMQMQEPLITQYVDLLITKLTAAAPRVVDIVAWMNFTTFDVIGDLAFGEPFGCLSEGEMHPWIESILSTSEKFGLIISARRYFPLGLTLVSKYAPRLLLSGYNAQVTYSTQQIQKRLGMTTSRPDFIDSMVNAEDNKAMSDTEIVQNARMLVLAGSETTASVLSNAAFLLCGHPKVQKKLAAEVRGAFTDEAEITFQTVQHLEYILAVLDETMRLLPAIPAVFPRVAAKGGVTVSGKHVPGGTNMDIFPVAMFRDERNFVDADKFLPERWLDDGVRDSRFDRDNRQAFQPFSVGPRNCIGKNLAYVEMRLILARVIWKFDMEFADECQKSWADEMLGYNLWVKTPLMVKLTPRKM